MFLNKELNPKERIQRQKISASFASPWEKEVMLLVSNASL